MFPAMIREVDTMLENFFKARENRGPDGKGESGKVSFGHEKTGKRFKERYGR